MTRALPAALFAGVSLYAATVVAGTPRYEDVVLSDAKDGKAMATFTPATPKLFVRANVVDAPVGTKLKGDWIAVKTAVAPANYKIDGAELTVFKGMTRADFSITRPNKGWPEGDYRIDMYIDGKKALDVKFRVAK